MKIGEYKSFQISEMQDFIESLNILRNDLRDVVVIDPEAIFHFSFELDSWRIANCSGPIRVIIEALKDSLEFAAGRTYEHSYIRISLQYAGSRSLW